MNSVSTHKTYLLAAAFLLLGCAACRSHESPAPHPPDPSGDSTVIDLADPTIFFDNGTYYLYGTGGNVQGFLVYASSDLKHWRGPAGVTEGYALVKGDTYGTQGFWAPQVFKRGNKFYMAYTADEHIAIAESDSPLGPFTQATPHALSGPVKQIDPFIFTDDNGITYLYHVRLENGNRLFVATLKPDLSDIIAGTAKECLSATEPWENTTHSTWPVCEGPTLLKHNQLYYLFYSANDFRDIHYAVGYATAPTPSGPWTKFSGNPIISRDNTGKNGTGHGDFIQNPAGELFYVLHTHRSDHSVSPRLTGIVNASFKSQGTGPDELMIDGGSFRYFFVGDW